MLQYEINIDSYPINLLSESDLELIYIYIYLYYVVPIQLLLNS